MIKWLVSAAGKQNMEKFQAGKEECLGQRRGPGEGAIISTSTFVLYFAEHFLLFPLSTFREPGGMLRTRQRNEGAMI